jgi:large subunit ribosomal protein L25
VSQVEVKAVGGREAGSRASRRIRREGMVPGVVYGAQSSPIAISCNLRELRSALSNRVAKGSILTLSIDGKSQIVRVQDVQVHPIRREVTHVDFLFMNAKDVVTSAVTLTAPTTLVLQVAALNVEGPASSIPAAIEVGAELANDAGEVMASLVPLPKGVKVVAETDFVVAKLALEE